MTAASIARAHGSRAIELRATVGMVTSRGGQPEFAAAMASLEESVAYFTPGEDSKDLVEALVLLREQSEASTTS